jgi:hypothetical protein
LRATDTIGDNMTARNSKQTDSPTKSSVNVQRGSGRALKAKQALENPSAYPEVSAGELSRANEDFEFPDDSPEGEES